MYLFLFSFQFVFEGFSIIEMVSVHPECGDKAYFNEG